MSDNNYLDIYRRKSDNFHQECPARMSDGSFLRDHRQAVDREMAYWNKIEAPTEHYYKNFLQANARKIIDTQWEFATTLNSCGVKEPCFHNYPLRSSNKEHREEMNVYDGVKTGVIKEGPKCEKHSNLSFNTKGLFYID